MIVVPSNIRYVRIFAGFLWRGHQMTVGLWRLSDFLAYFSNDVPRSHAHWHQNEASSAALPQLRCHGQAVLTAQCWRRAKGRCRNMEYPL